MNNKNGFDYTPTADVNNRAEGADYGGTTPLVGVDMNVPMDNWFDGPGGFADDKIGKTTPMRGNNQQNEWGRTMAVNPQGSGWADVDDYKTSDYGPADDYGPTMDKRYREETTAVRPVTGWLVCIEGVEKGKDYRLHEEINYIGRSKVNDVVLGSDPTVSRERHAMIAYDTRENMFLVAPSGGTSLIRQNGRPVLGTMELRSGDRLEIGECMYIFIALCGENFQW